MTERAPRRLRKRYIALGLLGIALSLAVFDELFHYDVWPTPTPFPAIYGGDVVSVEFREDGTVSGTNLPVWGGTACLEDPPRVTGVGTWYQERQGRFWIDIDGNLVRWGPDPGFYGSLDWYKIVLPHCVDYGPTSETVLGRR